MILHFATILHASQANVFVYHRFGDDRYPSTNVSLEDFRTHLEILKANDFQVLSLGEVIEKLDSDIELPNRCAVITVDDAYQSFMTNGWPLLKKYGFKATLFVSTDSVGYGSYLTWPQLRQLKQEGVEIGNHSASHPYLVNFLTEEDGFIKIKKELERSQAEFEVHLGFKPSLFAYPYGEFSQEIIDVVKEVGFMAAVGQQSGVITEGQSLFSLPRFPVGGIYSEPTEFRSKVFMRHLPIEVLEPANMVLEDSSPPELVFRLENGEYDKSTLRCFISGQSECVIKQNEHKPGTYTLQAHSRLESRRSKYTITASDPDGKRWFWYSHLWVLPTRR